MSKIFQIAYNATVAKLVQDDAGAADIIAEALSYEVQGASGWTGRSSFYSRSKRTFPAGFYALAQQALGRGGYQVAFVKKPLPAPRGDASPKVDEFGNDDPRYDFQLEALRQIEKHGRGIVRVATGGGKSKIAKLVMARYRRMTLFLTTRGVLLYQMKDQLDEFGMRNGVIGDGLWQPSASVNLGMVQTIREALVVPKLEDEVMTLVKKRAKAKTEKGRISDAELSAQARKTFDEKRATRERMIKLLSMIEVVIGEEAHEAGGASYYDVLSYCTNAHIRVALTATPFMRDDAQDNMRLMAAFGPVLISISEKMLIDRGILARPMFSYGKPAPHPKLFKSTAYQRAYDLGIVESGDRMRIFVNDCRMAKLYRLPAIGLVLRKEHGQTVEQILREQGINARFIRGEHDQAERKAALKALAAGEIDVLIGTVILDVGVDVPAVGYVGLLGGGKAEIALRQRVGRGLRAKKGMANVCFIRDFEDPKNEYLVEHAAQRRAIIETTPGFVENILPGEDFPWEIFAERKLAA